MGTWFAGAARLFLPIGVVLGLASEVPAFEEDFDQPMAVQCYRVDSYYDDYRFEEVGSVMVPPNLPPARACNVVEYACKNRCVACAHDYDYYEDICVDAAGRQFVK
ncbi:MAG TPA: hypothetical protein VNL74_01335 [Methylococcus sp.]|nr:hypothetical protein [Methylococcus sp.]